VKSPDIRKINTPTEVDHYQIRRVIDMFCGHQIRGAARAWGKRIDRSWPTRTDRNTT
jgi:hypothetical protein